MTDSPPISLVCFDLTSIVIDGSIVERAFAEAIATQGLVAGTQDYARSMVRFDRSQGRAPAAVLRDLFDGDEPRAQAASLAFERSFRATAQRFGLDVPVDVADAMGKTAGSGAKICLLTMLSRRSCGELLGCSTRRTWSSAATTRRAASPGQTPCSPRCSGSAPRMCARWP